MNTSERVAMFIALALAVALAIDTALTLATVRADLAICGAAP